MICFYCFIIVSRLQQRWLKVRQILLFWWQWHSWCQVFLIRTISPIPYNLDSQYLVNTLTIDYSVYLSVGKVSIDLDLIFMVWWLLNLDQVFLNGVNFSITKLVSPYLDLISQSTDFLKFAFLFVIRTVFTLPYNPCLLYLVPTSLMMQGTCTYLCICHLSLI